MKHFRLTESAQNQKLFKEPPKNRLLPPNSMLQKLKFVQMIFLADKKKVKTNFNNNNNNNLIFLFQHIIEKNWRKKVLKKKSNVAILKEVKNCGGCQSCLSMLEQLKQFPTPQKMLTKA